MRGLPGRAAYSAAKAGVLDKDDMRSRAPLGRMCSVDDVAASVLFLLSASSAFVTGQTIYVDGGYVWAG